MATSNTKKAVAVEPIEPMVDAVIETAMDKEVSIRLRVSHLMLLRRMVTEGQGSFGLAKMISELQDRLTKALKEVK